LPRTDALFTRLLMLPLNLMVSEEDVDYVSEKIRLFYYC
jgi:dTDP-4-amino-4,6-dideoxygalactose transaminase